MLLPSGSATQCSWAAGLRNLIAYADFLTMAAIALTRSLGIVNGYARRVSLTLTTTAAIGCCFLIWIISFGIISPTIFQQQLGNISFGSFGWKDGKCDGVDCNSTGVAGGGVISCLLSTHGHCTD